MKNILSPAPFKWVSGQSLNSSFTSPMIEVLAYYGLFIQANVTSAASLNGSLAVQYSADGVNWINAPTDASLAVNPKPLTATGSVAWEYPKIISYNYMRLSYTWTAGTGAMDVYLAGVRV